MKPPTKAQRQAWAKLLGQRGGLVGGRSTSPKKAAAARKNARLGGWPKGKPRKSPTI